MRSEPRKLKLNESTLGEPEVPDRMNAGRLSWLKPVDTLGEDQSGTGLRESSPW